MKKIILFAGLVLVALAVITSCQKQELDNQDLAHIDAVAAEEAGTIQAMPITSSPAVDLEITAYGSNVTTTTTACTGSPLPDVSCATPGHGFTAIISIRNNGPGNLPAGNFEVEWFSTLGGGPTTSQVLVVTHAGIPAGTSIRASRSYFLGPCTCVPPFTRYLDVFGAVVDPNNNIAETNENNNISPRFNACDGC